MDEANTMSAAENAAAESAGNAAPQEAVAPEGQGAESRAETGGEQRPAQRRQDNSRMAGLRRRAEAYDRTADGIMRIARAKGLNPRDADEAVELLGADAQGVTVEEYRRDQQREEAEEEARVRGSRFYKDLEARAAQDHQDAVAYRAQREMAADLEAIRRIAPEVASLDDLGDGYKELVGRGLSGPDAYYVLKGREAVAAAAAPPVTGAVGKKADTERDLTNEELDHLSDQDLKDPNLLERAIRSMRKLKA